MGYLYRPKLKSGVRGSIGGLALVLLLAGCGSTAASTNREVREWASSPRAEDRARAAEVCGAAAKGLAAVRRGESVTVQDRHVANVMGTGLGNPFSPCNSDGSPKQ